MKYICQKCGDTVTIPEENEPWDCSYCGGRVVPEDKSDVTPNEYLRELVEELRGYDETSKYDYQERIGLEIAAVKLEQVLEE